MLQSFRRRTWARRGCTPVQLASAKHHRRVSVIGCLALSPQRKRVSLYFQLTKQSFKKKEVIEFLKLLHVQLGRQIIVVWDRLNAHRSAAAWYAQHHPDWFVFEWLPSYSPELNPVEQCWSHTKCHEISNDNRNNVDELEKLVRKKLHNKRHRPDLLAAFFKHAKLTI